MHSVVSVASDFFLGTILSYECPVFMTAGRNYVPLLGMGRLHVRGCFILYATVKIYFLFWLFLCYVVFLSGFPRLIISGIGRCNWIEIASCMIVGILWTGATLRHISSHFILFLWRDEEDTLGHTSIWRRRVLLCNCLLQNTTWISLEPFFGPLHHRIYHNIWEKQFLFVFCFEYTVSASSCDTIALQMYKIRVTKQLKSRQYMVYSIWKENADTNVMFESGVFVTFLKYTINCVA